MKASLINKKGMFIN